MHWAEEAKNPEELERVGDRIRGFGPNLPNSLRSNRANALLEQSALLKKRKALREKLAELDTSIEYVESLSSPNT